jgi:hypothetical protein
LIKNIIKEEYEKLGSGNFGYAYKKEDKVHKIKTDEKEIAIAKSIEKSDYIPVALPTIDSVIEKDNKVVIIKDIYNSFKNLDEDSDINKLEKILSNNVVGINKYFFGQVSRKSIDSKFKDYPKFAEFIHNLKQDYENIPLRKGVDFIDIRLDNIGVKNNQYILFDF